MAQNKQESKGSLLLEFLYLVVWVVSAVLIMRFFIFEPYRIPSPSMVPTLEDGDFIYVSKYTYGFGPNSFVLNLPFLSQSWDLPVTQTINTMLGRDPNERIFGKTPERGDIVVFRTTDPRVPQRVVIKRVVGIPGDSIETRDGELFINGSPASYANRRRAISNSEDHLKNHRGFFYDETFPNLDGSKGHTHTITDFTRTSADNFRGTELLPSTVMPGHIFLMGDNRDNSGDSRTLMLGQVPMKNVIGKANFTLLSLNGPLFKKVRTGEISFANLLAVWKLVRWKRFMRPLI